MSVTGIKQSPLLDKAIKNDQSNVPIGAPVITHDVHRISSDIRDLITGVPLTEPMARQIGVDGQEGRETGRDPDKYSLTFHEETDVNARRIVEVSFNPKIGCLTLVRANKEEFQIMGFLRSDQLGVGPTGPRGQPGLDGRDGKDGRDGRKGATGCDGPDGKPGVDGEAGSAGREGHRGIQGPDGCEGPVGAVGIMGAEGRHGYEGARGLRGPSCVVVNEDGTTNEGAEGPMGAAFGEGVWMGQVAAAPMSVAIVGLPDDGIDSNVGAPPPPTSTNPEPEPPVLVPDPPKSEPAPPPPAEPPPPPPPPPVPPAASIRLCTSFTSARGSCGATQDAYSSVYANWQGPNGTLGLGMLPRDGQYRSGSVFSMIMCGRMPKAASYRFEIYVPPDVGATLFLNCAIKASVDYTGVRQRSILEIPDEDITSVRLRCLSTKDKAVIWCALRILDGQSGRVLYVSGQNAINAGISNSSIHPNGSSYKLDVNWAANTSVNHYM